MIALLGILFPFVKGLLGDGIVEKLLNHKRELATNATALEKANIEADVKTLELELQRRGQIKELQLREYEFPTLRAGKALILFSVGEYVFARVNVLVWGLDDYGVAIKPLDSWLEWVFGIVIVYMFMGNDLKRGLSSVIPKR